MPCPFGDMSQLGAPLCTALFAASAISASNAVGRAASYMKQIYLHKPVASSACVIALTVSAAVLWRHRKLKTFPKQCSDALRNNLRESLLGPKADEIASLCTIEQASDVFFGNSICLYGLSPCQFEGSGVRLCNRTVIECTNDRLALHTSLRVRSVLLSMGFQRAIVVDIMCGSGNLMMHLMKKLQSPVCLGFEVNACVAECTRTSLASVLCPTNFQSRCHIFTGDWIEQLPIQWQEQVATSSCLPDDAAVFVIAPPWGDGFCFERGLDLACTHPPIAELLQQLVATVRAVDSCGRVLFACVQTHEMMVEESVDALTRMHKLVARGLASSEAKGSNVGFLLLQLH